jgi:hypothetical protein
LALDAGEQTWSVTAPDLGVRLDAARTGEVALSIGDPGAHLRVLLGGPAAIHLVPAVSLDTGVAASQLRALAPTVAADPVNAALRIRGTRAEEIPSVPGRALDVEGTVAWLEAHLIEVVEGAPVPLFYAPVPAPLADLSALVDEANALLSRDVAIRAYDPVRDESLWWTAAPTVWAEWVTVTYDPGPPPAVQWTVHRDRVRAYLAERAGELGEERYYSEDGAVEMVASAILSQEFQVVLRLYHHATQHIVQAGETLSSIAQDHGFPYPWLQDANPSLAGLQPGHTVAIPSPDVLLPLPVVMHKRIVISIAQQRMWAYEWESLVWEWTVSTGIASSPTSPGVFQIQSHEREAYASSWDLWMPYFMGIYRPVPSSGVMNGFHGFPTRDGANLLWTGNLGHPVTFGCILLSSENASRLYEWAEEGVIVEIRR